MDLQTRKISFVQEFLALTNESVIEELERILEKRKLDPVLKEKLTSRALRAEKDIEEGRVINRQELEKRLNGKLGI